MMLVPEPVLPQLLPEAGQTLDVLLVREDNPYWRKCSNC